MEIRDNTFSRQFETQLDGKLVTVEYSFQERKIFLTKLNTNESDEESGSSKACVSPYAGEYQRGPGEVENRGGCDDQERWLT